MRCLGPAAALAAALALAACASDSVEDPNPVATDSDIVSRGADPLTAAEIRLYLRDSTLTHVGETRDWHVYLSPDGQLSGVGIGRDDEGRLRSRGTWTAVSDGADGLICRRWDSDWGGGLEGCATVYKYGDDYVFVQRGGPEGEPPREIRRTRRPGNPERL